ncbi:MAG: peptidase M19, partial [Cyanobacteria bacterium P01_H01_bin.58]
MLIAIFALGPAFIDKRFNSVGNSSLPAVSAESDSLHQSLMIVDLHADSLLWGRDLSQLSDYGHVDVPRLIQGNVALQIFTSVTKVPTPLLLEDNSADSDNVIKLAILQLWPIPTWFSLAERALYHAKQLTALERKASGQFSIIRTQEDLATYLTQRETNPQTTAGLLGI